MTKGSAKPAGHQPPAHPAASGPISKVNETEVNAATTRKLCSAAGGSELPPR